MAQAQTKAAPGPKGILIKCHGMYYYKTDSAKGTKPYAQDVRAPSLDFFRETTSKYLGKNDDGTDNYAERSFINIRGQLKKRLLPIMLSRSLTDFARVKFVTIDEIISETGETLDLPVQLCSRAQLAELIKKAKMPIDPDDYIDIDELRTDIFEYQIDAECFRRTKGRRDKKRSEERSFIEMNSLDQTLPPQRKATGIADI